MRGGRPSTALLAVALVALIPSPAHAATTTTGWWSQSSAASAVLDTDVPEGGLLVEHSLAGDIALSAVQADSAITTLTVAVVGTPVMTAPVRACRLTGVFAPVRAGAWSDRPLYDCTDSVVGTQSGGKLTFPLTSLRADGVVLLATGTSDRVAFGAPLVVLGAGATPDGTPTPESAPPLPSDGPGAAVAGQVAAPPPQWPEQGRRTSAQPVPAFAAPPVASAPARYVQRVTTVVGGSSTRRVAGTVVAFALLLGLLLYWSDGFGAAAWRVHPPTALPEVSMTQPDLPDLVRHEVRRQLSAGPRRYAPLAAAVAALLALVILVPDARQHDGSTNLGATTGDPDVLPGTTTGSAPGISSGGPGAAAGGSSSGASTGAAPTATSETTGGLPGSTGTAGGTTSGGVAPRAGIAGNGTRCASGVRQFSLVPYSPLCVPRFTGDNGGATAHGVTRTTITLMLRNPTDYEAGRSAVAASSFAAAQQDAQVLVKVFNKQFELYGRQVVLKSFTGRGSFIAEAAGQDQSGANADAQQAYDLGAFASGIPPDPQVYQNALSARGIISFGLNAQGTVAASRKAYPYQFQSLGPLPDFQAIGVADLVCGRMARLPASYAGDPVLAKKTRSFGLVMSQQAATADGGTNRIPSLVKSGCGQTVRTYTYQGNPASNASDASSVATRAKADGVTTLILISDLLFSPNLTNAAVQQSYRPEWLVPTLNRNQTARQMNATAVQSMVFMHPWKAQSFPADKGSCYRIYKTGDPNGEPQSDQIAGATFDSNCAMLLELFGAIQAAGPRLTPATFGQGFFSLPPSSGAGDFGKWSYDKDHYSPDSTYTLQYWHPTGTNPYDNGTGYYVDCREPADLPYVGATVGSGQLRCLGR